MDYYATLGLKNNASAEEIKKAYRSLAMKHHPDRGGDENRFKEIAQAYEFLSDPQKKQIIDMGGDPAGQPSGPQQSPFGFNFGEQDLNDIFRNFGFNFGHQQRSVRRNRSISIHVELKLEEVLTGKEFDAEISIPGGRKKAISIAIPKGVNQGQQIKYRGMGDNTLADVPPGDLLVNVIIQPHPLFDRNGESLLCEKTISVWDAIIGTDITIDAIDGRTFMVTVPPGTQPNTVLSCKGEGLPRMNYGTRGDLLIRLKVEIPKNLSETQKHLIETIKKNGI
jgi:curved DNA-binding protein